METQKIYRASRDNPICVRANELKQRVRNGVPGSEQVLLPLSRPYFKGRKSRRLRKNGWVRIS